MADISKIKLENYTYDLKDAVARAALREIQTITSDEINTITANTFNSFPSPIYGYDTINDMKTDPNLQEGMICYIAPDTNGIGKALWYRIKNVGEPDDIECSNELKAHLIDGIIS